METSDPKYKHKPSEKHTLEEVLKSLQDLIRNDLAEGAAAAAKPGSAPAESRQPAGGSPTAAEARSRRDSASSPREDFAPVAPGSGPVNLDAVLRSLKDLVGNELNVGDAPKPADTKPAETHEEYLAADEKIEEYIPEELARLGDELDSAAERVPDQPEAAPLRDESLAPEAIIKETLPQGFTPLDEELTLEELAEALPTPTASFGPEEIIEETLPQGFTPLDEELTLEELAEALPSAPDLTEEISIGETLPPEFVPLDEELTIEKPVEMAPPTPVVAEMPELPGEISPELAAEPELQPPPAPAIPPAAVAGAGPGTQQELFLEEPPPIELRLPPSEGKTAPASEPAPEPESPVTAAAGTSEMETDQHETAQTLPTIDIEKNYGTPNAIDTAPPSTENPPPASEELITLDVEISGTPETTPPAVEPVADTASAPEPPAAPAEKKITLAIVSGPLLDDPQSKPSVDFAAHGLEPPPPAAPPPPAPEAELPVIAVETDLSPAPDAPKATEMASVPETGTETVPAGESPATPAEPPAAAPPPALNLDDIPVLNEVVAPPAGSVPAAKPGTPPSTLPAPDRARDLVVRAVAKLNVEMRKSGGAGLDTKTILRLQQLIRQELEKSGEK